MESAILHFLFKMQKELSSANIEIKDILDFFHRQSCFPARQKYWQAIDKAEDFLEFSKLRPDSHCIFSAIFHLNKTKRKRNKLPISRMFPPMPINVLVLMMLRLGIYVSLYFKDAL